MMALTPRRLAGVALFVTALLVPAPWACSRSPPRSPGAASCGRPLRAQPSDAGADPGTIVLLAVTTPVARWRCQTASSKRTR